MIFAKITSQTLIFNTLLTSNLSENILLLFFFWLSLFWNKNPLMILSQIHYFETKKSSPYLIAEICDSKRRRFLFKNSDSIQRTSWQLF